MNQRSPCSDLLTRRPLGGLVVKSPHEVHSETNFHPVTRYKAKLPRRSGGINALCYCDKGGRGELAPCWTVCVPEHMQITLPNCISLGNELFVLILWILSDPGTRTRRGHCVKPDREIEALHLKASQYSKIHCCFQQWWWWCASDLSVNSPKQNKTGARLSRFCSKTWALCDVIVSVAVSENTLHRPGFC